MTRKIWKFDVELTALQAVPIPRDADILGVIEQGDDLYLYAMCDTDNDVESRVIEIIGTGNPIIVPNGWYLAFIGTVQVSNAFVWHVFERRIQWQELSSVVPCASRKEGTR